MRLIYLPALATLVLTALSVSTVVGVVERVDRRSIVIVDLDGGVFSWRIDKRTEIVSHPVCPEWPRVGMVAGIQAAPDQPDLAERIYLLPVGCNPVAQEPVPVLE